MIYIKICKIIEYINLNIDSFSTYKTNYFGMKTTSTNINNQSLKFIGCLSQYVIKKIW